MEKSKISTQVITGECVMNFNWVEDRIHDVAMPLLTRCQQLWDRQCFTGPEESVTVELIGQLRSVDEELQLLIADLQSCIDSGDNNDELR